MKLWWEIRKYEWKSINNGEKANLKIKNNIEEGKRKERFAETIKFEWNLI